MSTMAGWKILRDATCMSRSIVRWWYHDFAVFWGGSTEGIVIFVGCLACCGRGDVADILGGDRDECLQVRNPWMTLVVFRSLWTFTCCPLCICLVEYMNASERHQTLDFMAAKTSSQEVDESSYWSRWMYHKRFL